MKSLGWIQNLLAAFLVLLLAACSEKELILPGERQSVLPQLAVVTIDDAATGLPLTLYRQALVHFSAPAYRWSSSQGIKVVTPHFLLH